MMKGHGSAETAHSGMGTKSISAGMPSTLSEAPTPADANARTAYPTPPSSPFRTHPVYTTIEDERKDELLAADASTHVRSPLSPVPEQRAARLPPAVAETDLLDSESRLSILDFKKRLNLEHGHCGSLKKNSTERCKMRIPKDALNQLNDHIELLRTLTQSSLKLKGRLEDLHKLVTCRYHDHGRYKESRLSEWRDQFPKGNHGAAPTAQALADQIKRALGAVSTECVATVNQTQHCTKSLGGQRVQNCTRTIQEIVKPDVCCNDEQLDGYLRVLETNMYCQYHTHKSIFQSTSKWKARIKEVLSSPENKTWLPPTEPEESRPISPDFSGDLTKFWPEAVDTSPFDVIGTWNRLTGSTDPKSSYPALRKALCDPLGYNEWNRGNYGYIYLYEVTGNGGYVKIGWTSRSADVRHEEWSFKCNRQSKLLYPDSVEQAIRVPHARRVERLCHAELDYCRVSIFCQGCLQQHLEWFIISVEKAVETIQRWSRWMETNPYECKSLKDGDKWVLNLEDSQRTGHMERFIKDLLSIVPPSTQGDKPPTVLDASEKQV
ncbi:T5orf172 domain-containing protein [Xylariales sp. PMI_506]|nr:T5orf172 domain-containing protein [Xylariales sp. PMI_506]